MDVHGKALVTNAITNCYERRTNDVQTMEIREDKGKTGRFVQTFVTIANTLQQVQGNQTPPNLSIQMYSTFLPSVLTL